MAAGGHLEFWWLDWSKYKNDARNWFSMPKLVGKVVLHSFPFNLFSSYISNMAASGHFGFWLITNSAAIFARVMGAKFFLNTSKSSNQVSNLTMLSVVTEPPDCNQLEHIPYSEDPRIDAIRHRCDAKALVWYLIDVDLRVFSIWGVCF